MVKTLVLEPKAPSMDMVSQEGWQESEVVLAAGVLDPCGKTERENEWSSQELLVTFESNCEGHCQFLGHANSNLF
jgi:hypothetical protein